MLDDKLDRQYEEMVKYWVPKSPRVGSLLVKNRSRYLAVAKEVLACQEVSSFLDWGCGFPILTALLREHIECCVAYEPYGSDVHEMFAERHSIEILKTPPAEKFDVVAMVEVIEHIPVLQDVMPSVIDRIQEQGHLIATTPNGLRLGLWVEYLRRRRADPVPIDIFLNSQNTYQRHQREFTRDELKQTMEFFSLHVEEVKVTDIAATHDELVRSREIAGRAYPARRSLARKLIRLLSRGPFGPSLICKATRNK